MQLFKQKSKAKTSNKKLNFKKSRFFSKKRFLPVAGIFGLVGGYLVYQSFAYTPLLAGANGEFVALAPSRIMDTRNGNGGYSAPIPANGTYSLQVTGRGGVPAVAGVKSVVMSVAVVSPSANGYLTVWPSGVSKPNVSNINFVSGQNIANQVTVPVGADGKVQFSSSVSTQLIVDISGYYSSDTGIPGSRYNALSPARILDTRNGLGGFSTALPNNGVYEIQITGQGGVPAADVSSVVINVTAVSPTANGYTTVWPTGTTKPDSSSLNYVSGKTVAKLVTVPVGANGKVSMFNSGSATNYIFDVAGYYSSDVTPDSLKTQEGRFVSLNPSRIMDTRNGNGGYSVAIPANGTYSLTVNGSGGVPSTNVKAVVLNLTAVSPSANGFLTAWPSGIPKPNASNVNFVSGQSTANQAIIMVGSDGKIQLSSSVSTNIIVDVAGYFIDYEDQYLMTHMSGYIVNNDQASSLLLDTNTISQIAIDLNINELPTSDVKTAEYRSIQYSQDVNYANHKFHVLSINYTTSDSKATLTVQCYEDCQPIATQTNSVTYSGLTETTFNYNIGANKSYTITREILPAQQGYTGRRLVTSITVDGQKKDLTTERFNDGTNLGSFQKMIATYKGYRCKSNASWSHDIGNIKVNGVGGYRLSTSGPSHDYNPDTTPNCKGYIKSYLSDAALVDVNSSIEFGTPIISGDMQKIMGFKVGIPKAQRDVQPPLISNFQQTPTTCNGEPAVALSYDASDGSLITQTSIRFSENSTGSSDTGISFKSSGSGTYTYCKHMFATGTYNHQLVLLDDSGNEAVYPFTLVMP